MKLYESLNPCRIKFYNIWVFEFVGAHTDSGFGDDGDFNSNELNMEQEEDDFDGEEVGEEENDDGTRERIHESSSSGAALWDKALEFRFLLQKAFSSSHRIMDCHRYNVYEKIVNFMAPETMVVAPMLPDLNNLSGLKKQKPASVV
ncbi:protein bfr2-like [Pyrus ussuriensis x Pyrus communis]|uniref:Protein bfr2-like n=1 Tax=Pyrus ussuriensis x Pyrus communis TaxID=2448454 RepID=A0A5N5HBS3_9ROSA|nr:protein bfr2-like [Pyrus ussuriensis x Pyrus communis]